VRRLLLLCLLAFGLLSVSLPAQAIVRGKPASISDYPWMASVQRGGGQWCGGTVITSRWILTAAHCVVDTSKQGLPPFSVSGFTVVTGRTKLSSAGGQVRGVTSAIAHPGFQGEGSGNDAALLYLDAPITAPRITLSTSAYDFLERSGTAVRATGWGDTTGVGLLSSDSLRQVDLKVVSDHACGKKYTMDTTKVCAKGLVKDTCYGDSGGPLFGYVSGRAIQIGIVSYGFQCAVPGFPGVYSEVNSNSIRTWIKTTTGV
jgi:trypsin